MNNRFEFMAELEKRLDLLDKEDKQGALDYYNEYFDEAGICNEEDAVKNLGDPSIVAANILSNFAVAERTIETSNMGNEKRKMNSLWYIFLGICALPMALPLTFFALGLVFAAVALVFALIISIVLPVIALMIAGIGLLVGGIMNISFSVPFTLILMGAGLILGAMGLLLTLPIYQLIHYLSAMLLKIISQIFKAFSRRINKNGE